MLMVDSYIKISSIHGYGLFSNQFIPKGTIIWKYDPLIDKKILIDSVMSKTYREYLEYFAWKENNYYILAGDNAIFTNHSLDNNIELDVNNGNTIAKRDILLDEELLEDYNEMYGYVDFKVI